MAIKCITCKKPQDTGSMIYCDECHTHICRNIESKGQSIAATAQGWQKRARQYFQLAGHGIIALTGADELLKEIASVDLGGE